MFISAIAAIGGRQQQVQFAQGTKEFDAKIRDIINDVTTGFYPTNNTVSCGILANEVEIRSSTNQQIGTNSDCIYVGKAIHFQVGEDNTMIRIYSMAGKRFFDDTATPVTTIEQARPKAVALPNVASFTKTSEDYKLPYGIKVTRVIRPKSSTVFTDYGAIAIMNSFGGASLSESQSVIIGGLFDSRMGGDESEMLSVINKITDASSLIDTSGYLESNTAEGLVICLESQEGRKASLSVGVKIVLQPNLISMITIKVASNEVQSKTKRRYYNRSIASYVCYRFGSGSILWYC